MPEIVLGLGVSSADIRKLLTKGRVMPEPHVVRPEDVLSDAANSATFNSIEVRKGSVGAFIANAKAFDSLSSDDPRYVAAEAQLRELIPGMHAIGLFDVLQPRSEALSLLVGDAPD